MDQFGITASLIGLMFMAIIGVYGWTYTVSRDTNKQLAKIYEVVNGHLQNTRVHMDEVDDFVATKLCDTIHARVGEDLTEIKQDVKSLLSKA